jgi:hypothetical protein
MLGCWSSFRLSEDEKVVSYFDEFDLEHSYKSRVTWSQM